MGTFQDNARMRKTITRLRKKNHELEIESVEQRKILEKINDIVEYCQDAMDNEVHLLIKEELKKYLES